MKLKDAERVKVEINYALEYDKEERGDSSTDELIKCAEKDCVRGSGNHDYSIYGWNGTDWESIDDED